MRCTFVGLASVACLAASASGQGEPTYDARLCFALGNSLGGAVIDDNDATVDFTVTAPGNFLFQVVGGIFNATNFETIPSPPGVPQASSNRGIGNWIGAITTTDGNLNIRQGGKPPRNQARVPPFNFGLPAGEGMDGDSAITGIDAARGSVEVAWPAGEPIAPQPPSLGNETFTRLYRFNIDITDLSVERDIRITASGTMVAIANWGILSQTPPFLEPGVTQWAPVPAGGPREAESCTLLIRVIPAPSVAAVLGLGGLGAARRRRG